MPARGYLYWALVALSAATLVLVIVTMILSEGNRRTQLEVNQRQQFINQSLQLGRVREGLIRTMAQAAVAQKDDKLRDLLAQYGITINAPTAAPEAAAPAAAAPAGGK